VLASIKLKWHGLIIGGIVFLFSDLFFRMMKKKKDAKTLKIDDYENANANKSKTIGTD